MTKTDYSHLVRQIKAFGAGLGFSQIGIASPVLSGWNDRINDWIGEGFHGEMQYMARGTERRSDLSSVFPEVKSVIVTSINYYPGKWRKDILDDPSRGYIANYALNEDYHLTVVMKLKELLWHINNITDGKVRGKIYADTGPVSEKGFAVMAGLGWTGKHTLLVNQDAGSWLLLGVLLLDLELPPDEPVADQCGSCTRCMDACPTRAIVKPYMIDARRCISYLLGELKGPVPPEMEPLIGNRIFGCDDCQWACPWNKSASVSGEAAFRPREDLASPLLSDLIDMDEDRFNSMFNNNPVKRIKREKFLRNVGIARDNGRDKMKIQ